MKYHKIGNEFYMDHGEMKKKKKVIFLDDKILCKYIGPDNVGVDELKVIKLKLLSMITKAQIILISDDRYEIYKMHKAYITYNQFKSEHNRLIYLLRKYNIKIDGVVPSSINKRKCDEILTWLSRNERGTLKYIILSTKSNDFDALNSKVILCRYGLRLRHIYKTYKKLNYTVF